MSVYSRIEEELTDEIEALEARLAVALDIVDGAARESLLDQSPCYAFPMLTEDEQVRLYALLKGGDE